MLQPWLDRISLTLEQTADVREPSLSRIPPTNRNCPDTRSCVNKWLATLCSSSKRRSYAPAFLHLVGYQAPSSSITICHPVPASGYYFQSQEVESSGFTTHTIADVSGVPVCTSPNIFAIWRYLHPSHLFLYWSLLVNQKIMSEKWATVFLLFINIAQHTVTKESLFTVKNVRCIFNRTNGTIAIFIPFVPRPRCNLYRDVYQSVVAIFVVLGILLAVLRAYSSASFALCILLRLSYNIKDSWKRKSTSWIFIKPLAHSQSAEA